jgi:hypothetical protein
MDTHHLSLRQMIHTKRYVRWNGRIVEKTHSNKQAKQRTKNNSFSLFFFFLFRD